ncbi:MAG: DNA-methyltransferase [Candidatus Heimdallarchaeota archaeon]
MDLIPENLVQCCITSPTYWGKRSFSSDQREFGSESLEKYIQRNVDIYSAILDKLREDGSLFFIMQDSYMGSGISRSHHNYWENNLFPEFRRDGLDSRKQGNTSSVTARHKIIRNKSLCGIPFRIAVDLVMQRYIWRELIIWEKPNPMPENVKDRVRQSSEYILHFTKKGKYKFDPEPMMVPGKSGRLRMDDQVWIFAPEPKRGHTATFPSKIVKRLLLATTEPGDTVFDPFLGSGTMMDVCLETQRKFIGCDLNRSFVEEAADRAKSVSFPKKRTLIEFMAKNE